MKSMSLLGQKMMSNRKLYKTLLLNIELSFLVIHSAVLASTFHCPGWCSFKIIGIPSQAHRFTNTKLCAFNNNFFFGLHI